MTTDHLRQNVRRLCMLPTIMALSIPGFLAFGLGYVFRDAETINNTDWQVFDTQTTASIILPMIENDQTYYVPWTITVEYKDGSTHSPVLEYQGSSGLALKFGDSGHPVKGVSMTTDYFNGRILTAVITHILYEPSYATTVNYKFGSYSSSTTSQTSVVSNLDASLSFGGLGPMTRGDNLSIELFPETKDGQTSDYIAFRNLEIQIRTEKDPMLALPASDSGRYTFPWNANGITIPEKDESTPFFTSAIGSGFYNCFTVDISPLFEPEHEPSDISPELKERQKNNDAYYTYDASAAFTDDMKHILLNVPCSGKYRVTLRYTPTLAGYYAAEISRDYDIYPVAGEIQLNGHDIADHHVELTEEYDGQFKQSYLDYKYIQRADCFYKVGDSSRTFNVPAADDGSQWYYTVPEDFSRLTASGIDLTQGSELSAHLVKNGATGPLHSFSYTLNTDYITGTGTPETDDAEAEYFTLTGLRVSRDNISPGIYIRRTPTSVTRVRF